ncbi:Na(+)/H(+) antiporter subunit B [Streptomyces sp. CG1]|uniref:Na(+)/H(+) antiporter subunit B n=1 Tax=Streptomyces sp. CG1 TaxID=1287523 RepID=UPI0034E1F707
MNTATAQEYLIAIALVLVAASATAAALARDPVRQAVLGLCLTVLFTVLQAPDVALSQLAVGTAVTPLLILLTVRKVRRTTASHHDRGDRGPEGADES